MSARFFAWYSCGVLSLTTVLLLFVSVVPGAETRLGLFQAALGAGAIFFGLVAKNLSRKPREYWGNRSSIVRYLMTLAAILSSLLAAAIIV
jgi:hypothetical protein